MRSPDSIVPADPTRLDRLRIAFVAVLARRVVAADGKWDQGEVELLSRTFPADLMARAGLLDGERRLTADVKKLYRQALAELPRVLTLDEKLDLLTLLHRTGAADGSMDEKEMAVLQEASAMLEVRYPALLEHLRNLALGGSAGTSAPG